MTETALGVDIGGTKISAAVVKEGQLTSDVKIVSTPQQADEIFGAVDELIEFFMNNYKIDCTGIATAGVVDTETGAVLSATENLASGYSGMNYRQFVREKYGLDTFVDNDANAAAFAEHKFGAAKGCKNSLTVTIGTGIGGGIVIDNKLYRGHGFAAGECGHIQIDVNSQRECTCGKTGCWEAYATGHGLLRTFKELVSEKSSVLALHYPGLLENVDQLTIQNILDGVKEADVFCSNIYVEWHYHIASGLVSLMNVLAPECIVIGGGWAEIVDMELIGKFTEKKSPSEVRVIKAHFDNNAGIIGIAALASENCG